MLEKFLMSRPKLSKAPEALRQGVSGLWCPDNHPGEVVLSGSFEHPRPKAPPWGHCTFFPFFFFVFLFFVTLCVSCLGVKITLPKTGVILVQACFYVTSLIAQREEFAERKTSRRNRSTEENVRRKKSIVLNWHRVAFLELKLCLLCHPVFSSFSPKSWFPIDKESRRKQCQVSRCEEGWASWRQQHNSPVSFGLFCPFCLVPFSMSFGLWARACLPNF